MNTFNFEIDVPAVANRMVEVILMSSFPPVSKQSRKIKEAAVKDLIDAGMDPAQAEATVSGRANLFPDGEIRELRKPYNAFIYWLDRHTGKWMGHGNRICSVHAIDKIEQKFAEMQLMVMPLWNKFVEQYDAKLQRLVEHGGSHFELELYPTHDEVQRMFRLELAFKPIANPDQFDMGGLTPTQVKVLKDRFNEQIARAAEEATKCYAADIKGLLDDMSRQLLGGKQENGKFTRFSDSNIKRLRDMLDAKLNVIDSHELNMALIDVEAAVRSAEHASKVKGDKYLSGDYKDSVKSEAAMQCRRAAKKLAGIF